MGAKVRVTRSLAGNSAFAAQVEAATAKKAAKMLQRAADLAVIEANKIIAAEFVNDRDPDRRRHGAHLLGSISVDVEWDGRTFPITLVARSSAPKAKVGALEKGAPPHTITAVNTDRLAFPSNQRGLSVVSIIAAGKTAARHNAHGPFGNKPNQRGKLARPVSVNHPGNQHPRHFMERALNRAVRKVLASARPGA